VSNIRHILKTVERKILKQEERSYFFTHEARYQFILKQIQKNIKEKKLRVLDIGCFPYHIGKTLELLGHEVYGISSYHEPIKQKNIAILNIEKDKFPYANNFFDMVLFNEVIEHLPQSPVVSLKEIHRVTKKDGHIMITTPNITRSINRAKLLFGKTIMFPLDVYFKEDGKGNNIYHRHNREYTLYELEILLAKTLWKIEEKRYFISYTPFRKRTIPDPWFMFLGKFINYLLMLIIPSFRDTLFILGSKS